MRLASTCKWIIIDNIFLKTAKPTLTILYSISTVLSFVRCNSHRAVVPVHTILRPIVSVSCRVFDYKHVKVIERI